MKTITRMKSHSFPMESKSDRYASLSAVETNGWLSKRIMLLPTSHTHGAAQPSSKNWPRKKERQL